MDPKSEIGAGLFGNRDKNVELLGFASYADYLQSDLWAWIRSQLMQQDNAKCCNACQSTLALGWHHTFYDLPTLAGNNPNKNTILRLCNDCHRVVHIRGDGVWVSLDIANGRLVRLLRSPWGELSRVDIYSNLDVEPGTVEHYSFDGEF